MHSSPNVSQNSFKARLIRSLLRRASVLAFLPLESTNGTLSFLTRIPTWWTNWPLTSISHSKCLVRGTCPSSTPFRLNRLCELLYVPDEGSKQCSMNSLKYDSFIRVHTDLLSSRLFVGLPLMVIIISGHGVTAWCMISNLLSSLMVLHESSCNKRSKSSVVQQDFAMNLVWSLFLDGLGHGSPNPALPSFPVLIFGSFAGQLILPPWLLIWGSWI